MRRLLELVGVVGSPGGTAYKSYPEGVSSTRSSERSHGRAFARTGAAARKPAARTAAAPRRRRTAATTTPRAPAAAVAPAAAPAPVQPDVGQVRLALALAALDDDKVRAAITGHRSRLLDDAEWAQVADLVQLGAAVAAPAGARAAQALCWARPPHAPACLKAGPRGLSHARKPPGAPPAARADRRAAFPA